MAKYATLEELNKASRLLSRRSEKAYREVGYYKTGGQAKLEDAYKKLSDSYWKGVKMKRESRIGKARASSRSVASSSGTERYQKAKKEYERAREVHLRKFGTIERTGVGSRSRGFE